MTAADDLASFPDSFPQRLVADPDAPVRRYEKREGCFALHGGSGTAADGLRLLYRLEAESIDVLEGSPEDLPADAGTDVCSVYALTAEEPPAVPTGRIFVTFERASDDEDDDARLEDTAYEVESRVPYAPGSAWVVARDGSIATALGNLEALSKISGVVSLEPQMLRPASRRAGGGRARR